MSSPAAGNELGFSGNPQIISTNETEPPQNQLNMEDQQMPLEELRGVANDSRSRQSHVRHHTCDLDDDEGSDIYRGEHPPIVQQSNDIRSISSRSSSSSSSSNFGALGNLASVVEAAISRWARLHTASSSSSSSSDSSSSSSASATRHTHVTRNRKGRRYSSTASLHNAQHERAFLARKKAREEFRIVPREFTLLLPSDLAVVHHKASKRPQTAPVQDQSQQRIITTDSLPEILRRLDMALKKSAKWKRREDRLLRGIASPMTGLDQQPLALPGVNWKRKVQSEYLNDDRLRSTRNATHGLSSESLPVATGQGWWLDVASPTWDDMRSIGQVLHLHPLTLEDILHQEAREKLEIFPRLGYYFIVFRALESERSRERFRRFKNKDSEGMTDVPRGPADEGIIGAVNVYLIVFREGICSFHFEDISEHTEKLRNKVLHLENTVRTSPDWIAHGLLDSIVDSFFPVLVGIEKEVKSIDALVLEGPSSADIRDEKASAESPTTLTGDFKFDEKCDAILLPDALKVKEDSITEKVKGKTTYPLTIVVLDPHVPFVRRLRSFIRRLRPRISGQKDTERPENRSSVSPTQKTLLKMAATRRIVTSLGRLLSTKGDVVSQIRKRLLSQHTQAGKSDLPLSASEGAELAIYMGDVQDHIDTLMQSLAHYERMLSHSHPAYLSQLRVSQALAKGGTDKAILILTVISITVLCIQFPLGLFSMNIHKIPTNLRPDGSPGGPFNVFFIILSLSVVIGVGVLCLFRYWRLRAKRKFSRRI